MLKLTVSLADAAGPWTRSEGAWRCGESVIDPVAHPALETVFASGEGGTRVVVRERCPGRDGRDHTDDWPGDFIAVELQPRRVRLHAGLHGVAPVYLACGGGTLHGSWDLAGLRGAVSGDRLVDREVARLLTMQFRYGRDILFAGAVRITERSAAVFTDDGLQTAYPAPALHGRARRLRESVKDADVIAAYEQLLGTAVTARAYDPGSACVELSGGLDSANVAATLGALHSGQVTAAAMIILGEAGIQQVARRAALIRILGLGSDVSVGFAGHLPLSPSGRRGSGLPVTPYEDPYDEAKAVLVRQLAELGVTTVFTGVGGDEMVARTTAEFPHLPLGAGLEPMPWIGQRTLDAAEEAETGIAPAAVVNEMTLIAQACAAPAFLRAGIWPVHPLADPDLIRFGEWLPLAWRQHKRLHQARLEVAGCPSALLKPRLRENFTPVMREALRQHGLPLIARMLASGSLLIDTGYVNPDGLAAVHRRLADGGEFRERETELYGLIVMDMALRSFN
jgi:asparagine synthase (glutamine-hydrolysing)